MKKLTFKLSILFLAATLMLGGCKKKTDSTTDLLDSDSNAVASDHSEADQTTNDGFDMTNDALAMKGGLNKDMADQIVILNGCAQVTFDSKDDSTTNRWPKHLTIRFKSTSDSLGCLGKDGRYRKGAIHITLTDKFRNAGSVCTITYDNFYVNNNKIEGTKIVTNQGLNASGNLVWKIEVNKSKLRDADGKTVTWQSTRYNEEVKIPGTNTTDYWLITGESSGTTKNGKDYTVKITKALKVKRGCAWITQGTLEITPANGTTRTIDFGDGNCDRLATITVLGKTYTFEMKK